MQTPIPKLACLALSGGLDSSSLLIHLLAQGFDVTALSFLYGQKHSVEIQCAENLISYLSEKNYPVLHHKINLNNLENLLFSSLMKTGEAIPEGHYTETNMRSTVVPNRNKIFISILQSAALSLALKENKPVLTAMGVHAGDRDVYPDCRPEFIEQDYQAFLSGNWDGHLVKNYIPYQYLNKTGILQDGLKSCEILQLDFDEIYSRTITSYQPSKEGFSDYKTSSSIQRIEAFININRKDPIVYAGENGVVNWQTVKNHVLSVLNELSMDDKTA